MRSIKQTRPEYKEHGRECYNLVISCSILMHFFLQKEESMKGTLAY